MPTWFERTLVGAQFVESGFFVYFFITHSSSPSVANLLRFGPSGSLAKRSRQCSFGERTREADVAADRDRVVFGSTQRGASIRLRAAGGRLCREEASAGRAASGPC